MLQIVYLDRQEHGQQRLKIIHIDDADLMPEAPPLSIPMVEVPLINLPQQIYPEFDSLSIIAKAVLLPETWNKFVAEGIPLMLYLVDQENDGRFPRRDDNRPDHMKVSGSKAILTICPATTHLFAIITT